MPIREPVMPEDRAITRGARKRGWVRVALVLFHVALGVLLVLVLRKLDLGAILGALHALPEQSLLLAAACSALAYAAYAGYEILAARTLGVRLPAARLATIGCTSYAFNLSLGAIVGGLGVRMRLYAQQRIPAADSVAIVALNLMTNWSGYLVALGVALLVHAEAPFAGWIGSGALRALGIVLLVGAFGYAWACARARRRSWSVRGHRIVLPGAHVAVRQFALSVPAWLATAAALAILLADAAFDQVVIALLAASVIGLVIRVPAGLGVLEAVFVAAFGSDLGDARVLAALLAFRCVHYLLPLAVACVLFVHATWQARRHATT